MALTNNGARSIQNDSRFVMRSGSPTKPSVAASTVASAGQDIRGAGNIHQQGNYAPRSAFNLELQQATAADASKEATTQDFLSLCGNKSGIQPLPPMPRGASAPITTREFFLPLEKFGVSTSGDPSTHAYTTASATACLSSRLVKGSPELPSSIIFGERSLEYSGERLTNLTYWPVSQPKFSSADSGLLPKTGQSEYGRQHTLPVSKQWQQSGTDVLEISKRAGKVASEEDEDEDDDYGDRSFAGDTSQKVEGKGNDNKGNTPRSKHSATERRRRSKINDRFQMLRQLVPNHDQKRDKASFLLEVIEYIQFLQEKARKLEALEHGWQQDRTRCIPWDAGQRSPVDSSHTDSLVYTKEPVSTVSQLHFDVKQSTEANGVIRPKSTPFGISEIAATELHSAYSASQCRLTSLENKAVPTKPSSIPMTTQPSIHFSFGRTSPPYVFHSFPHTTEIQTVAVRAPHEEQPVQPTSNLKTSFYNQEATNMAHLHGNKFPPVQSTNNVEDRRQLELNAKESELNQSRVPLCKAEAASILRNLLPVQSSHNVDDQKQLDFNIRKPESNNLREPSNANSAEGRETAQSLFAPDRHHVSGASSSRQIPSEDALASRSSSETQCDTHIHPQANDQEGLAIHGGIISISTNYSQGLLDTLTRALQSSGLDLSQASISVEIKLGRQVAAMPITMQKEQRLASEALQQSQTPGKEPLVLSGYDPPNKRTKFEVAE